MFLLCLSFFRGRICVSDGADIVFEVFAVDGFVAHLVAVGVDGANGVVQNLCDARTLGDAELDEGVDAHLDVHTLLPRVRVEALLGAQKKVDLLDEIGVKLHERAVEYLENLILSLLVVAAVFEQLEELAYKIAKENE